MADVYRQQSNNPKVEFPGIIPGKLAEGMNTTKPH